MLATVTKPKTKTAPKKSSPPEEPARKKTKLTLVAEEAARAFLLATLRKHGWNLTHAAESLDMSGAAAVIKAIKSLGLSEEYADAKQRGEARPGRPS